MTDTTLTAVGFGYTHSNPPEVLIELPPFQTEKVTSLNQVEGFTGIITGITTTTNSGHKQHLSSSLGRQRPVQVSATWISSLYHEIHQWVMELHLLWS